MSILKKTALTLAALLATLALLVAINPQIRPSHTEPYLALAGETSANAPIEAEIRQRVILYGDAGHSTTMPWQASMAKVSERASISPAKTAVVALGDNIYMQGYPQKETGQADWNEEQLESISYLDAQLKVASESGASMYFVPGNHDWYATELDSQAAHIAAYAEQQEVATEFHPLHINQVPLPTATHRDGVSLVYIDSEWMLRSVSPGREQVLSHLEQLLTDTRRQYPDNLIVINAHHPLETMGQHGGYLAEFAYWLFIKSIFLVFPEAAEEDTYDPLYQRMIADLEGVMGKFQRLIYAAGHEHSLQVFRPAQSGKGGPQYTLVSGAGNSNKISGVWHNENTRMALAQEGFLELNVTGNGVYLQVFDIHNEEARAGFWLAL